MLEMRHASLAAGCLLALCIGPAIARAGKGEKVLSLVPHYSSIAVTQGDEERTGNGGGLGVDYERGITDVVWLRASARGAVYDGPNGLAWSGGATVGITWALDIFRYVPYANLGLGALVVGGGLDTELKPVVELGFGMDVLESRKWSWGFVFRFDSFASQARFFTIGPRISWRWGFF